MATRLSSVEYTIHASPTHQRRHYLTSASKTGSPVIGQYYHQNLSEISEIIEGKLYLSGCEVVTVHNLLSRGITAVVSAITPWEAQRTKLADRLLSAPNLKIFPVPVLDSESTDINAYFEQVIRFIDDELSKGGKVLVHCVAGVSRSTTLILAYLVSRGYALLDAFNLVAEKRKIAWPNDGFYRQLIRYERSLKKNPVPVASNGYHVTRNRSRSPGLGIL